MFHRVLVEEKYLNHPVTERIKQQFPSLPVFPISSYEQYFGKVKKPYLQKRKKLNIILGEKKGQLVKEAPQAYGVSGNPHYYFIHAYNCLYECEYCYLQGYFQSPDLVLFLNHDKIQQEIENLIKATPESLTPWFHAGEFSDSLAVSHLTNELEGYFNLFSRHPRAKLELRTKSNNIKALLDQNPLENVITTFSLAPEEFTKTIDRKTPPLKLRLKAMNGLEQKGFPLGIHLDPMVYSSDFKADYQRLIEEIQNSIDLSKVHYISLGVVRFTKEVYKAFTKNYPQSPLHLEEFQTSFDGKKRYARPMRNWMLSTVKELLLKSGCHSDQIYLCMEDD